MFSHLGASCSLCWLILAHLGLHDASKTLQDGPKMPPRRLQDAPGRLKIAHLSLQDASKPLQEPPKMRPKTHLGAQKPPRSIFDRFLIDFWSIFGRFLHDFLSKLGLEGVLGGFWEGLGTRNLSAQCGPSVFVQKCRQHGRNLAPQIDPKS